MPGREDFPTEIVEQGGMKDTETGTVYEYLDYPTDGPLFRDLSEDNPEFDQVQFDTDEFHEQYENGTFVPCNPDDADGGA